MNFRTHPSAQMSGQLPNQSGSSLLPQQNTNSVPQHGILRNLPVVDQEFIKARKFVQEKIWEFLLQRHPQAQNLPSKRILDIVKRLEETLLKSAMSRDEYLNMDTFENRLQVLIRHLPMSQQNQQPAHGNSAPSVGAMIPTPGFQQTANSSLMGNSSVATSAVSFNSSNTIASSTVNSGSFLPTRIGSSGNLHGAMGSGFQQSPAVFSVETRGNDMVTSVGSRMPSQMIPTPGINNSSSSDMNNNANTYSLMNMESSNSTGAYPAATESAVAGASQSVVHKQRVGGQNSRILHNIGGYMGDGLRSTLQQKSYGLSNGPVSGGLGMMGKNMPVMISSGANEGHLAGILYGTSTKPLQSHFDQLQQPVNQGDGYGIGAADGSGSRNLYAPVTSGPSLMNNQSLNPTGTQSLQKISMPLMTNNQLNAYTSQPMANLKPQSVDQPDNVNHLSQYPLKGNLGQPHYQQQFQHPSNEFQHRIAQHSTGQENKQQNQHLLKSDSFNRPLLSSNIVSEVKSDFGTEHTNVPQSQASNFLQVSDQQNQYQLSSIQEPFSAAQLLSHSSGPQNVHPSSAQRMEQMQQFHNQQVSKPRGDFGSVFGGIQHDAVLHGQSYMKSQDTPFIQDGFHQGLTGEDVTQPTNVSPNVSVPGSRLAEPLNSSDIIYRCNNLDREQQHKNQTRWILFLKHAQRCPYPEGKCLEPNCLSAQKLWKHMESCNVSQCKYPRCDGSKRLYDHYLRCQDQNCPVCVPVKNFIKSQRARALPHLNSGVPCSNNGPSVSHVATDIVGNSASKMGQERVTPNVGPDITETPEDLQSPMKRLKTEQGCQPLVAEIERPVAFASSVTACHLMDEQHNRQNQEVHIPIKVDVLGNAEQRSPKSIEMKKDDLDDTCVQTPKGEYVSPDNLTTFSGAEVIKREQNIEQIKPESTSIPTENAGKTAKPKIKGVSMIELFTPEEVRQHIMGLRQWVGQSKAKVERNQAMGHSMSENSCQLCGVERLTFEPPPLYCTPCGARIKRNAMYYTFGAGETSRFFCIPCYNEARGDSIVVDGTPIPKARVDKKKNDEETEEWWVQCDECEAWQHQICALFNGRRNDGGQAEYTCPNCYMKEIDNGLRVPLPRSAVLGAKDLPRTSLSDHLEQRLFTKLKQERKERARHLGKTYDEVPGADALVVRVVSSVDKKLEVKPRFLEIFREQNYPLEYPYKSKVILLFQRIEGVEVCLFGMYVQEFGSECEQPNHRRVYLSYLDSVKYFRPEVKAVTGEALRTFVYHEILIGYLESCKKRGFTSCYIWACPPLKGEDYILYCHPEIQKTPKSDKLREWYLAMLRKAAKENIVVDLTNLYEHFFVCSGESKAKVTAARLPYFDGDYWPGAAEDIIYQLQQEDDGKKPNKKGAIKKSIMKRALKASGQTDLTGNASKDLMLMHKLGETISPMKEDFIMVHLQHACTHCCILMVSGNRWVCRQCKNFQLCDKCYDTERRRDDRERHPVNQKDAHTLYPVEITGVPEDTRDNEIMESEFFDTRQAFLTLCQINHYQYDTLRRAKHSSMMVLYHLHNPTAPAFVSQCAVCHLDIESGRGWRCETCPDYDVCNACYERDGGADHPHKLTNQQTKDHDAQNTEARQQRVAELRKMLELLVHAAQCRSMHCQYPNCRKVKGLFRHGMGCKIRAAGGCPLCKKMWHLLQLHAHACKESTCHVPRCRDLKVHLRRVQQQSDSRRRAAVNEMMRQRAAEVGSSR
ncbi:histone acetyltransferase HAC1-like [Andrographis paniculata]|uniref:histone acetyltransferase HAC1-like n=1 Tax=Andrographis paniculata TaxID=175694 RepID=UPI0021E799BA|nr:histone acetyltransferase HAC1-like [Andrographis paniculata]